MQRQQVLAPGGGQARVSLQQRLEIVLEAQHNLLRLRTRIQLGVGRQVVEKDQGLFAEFAQDALPGHVALHKTTIAPHYRR